MSKISQSSLLTLFLFVSSSLTGCFISDSLAPSRASRPPEVNAIRPDILKRYDAFYVPEIETVSIEGDILRKVSSSDVQHLAQSFRYKIMRQLGDKYSTFSQPAKNVAILKILISDVSSTYAMFQLTPGLLVPNPMRGGATINAKVVDSIDGKEVLTFNDTRQGSREGFFSGFGKWDGVEKAFDEWASQLGAAISTY